jgi:hypothetical protein
MDVNMVNINRNLVTVNEIYWIAILIVTSVIFMAIGTHTYNRIKLTAVA